MLSNGNITLYHANEGYKKEIIKDVFMYDKIESVMTDKGLKTSKVIHINIPKSSVKSLIIATGKDIIVKGINSCNIDNTNEETQSESIKELKKSCGSYYITKEFSEKLYGSEEMQHYEVVCY